MTAIAFRNILISTVTLKPHEVRYVNVLSR